MTAPKVGMRITFTIEVTGESLAEVQGRVERVIEFLEAAGVKHQITRLE